MEQTLRVGRRVPRCSATFPLLADPHCHSDAQYLYQGGECRCWRHQIDGDWDYLEITFPDADTIPAAEAEWIRSAGLESGEGQGRLVQVEDPPKPWVCQYTQVRHDPFGFITYEGWTHRFDTEEQAKEMAQRYQRDIDEGERKRKEQEKARIEATDAAFKNAEKRFSAGVMSAKGPALQAGDNLLAMLEDNEESGIIVSDKFILLGWSPFGHHFVIGEYASAEEAVFLGTNWEPEGHLYAMIVPPQQELKGTKSRLFPSMENRDAAIKIENLDFSDVIYTDDYGEKRLARRR